MYFSDEAETDEAIAWLLGTPDFSRFPTPPLKVCQQCSSLSWHSSRPHIGAHVRLLRDRSLFPP